jgi:hypothetical protein
VIAPLGFVDVTAALAAWQVKHRAAAVEAGPYRVVALDEATLSEWRSARALLARLAAHLAPGFDGRTPVAARALVVELPTGATAPWAVDEGDVCRVHVPLVSPPGFRMYAGVDMAAPSVGQILRVDHRLPNAALNLGPWPAVHLVVDFAPPE